MVRKREKRVLVQEKLFQDNVRVSKSYPHLRKKKTEEEKEEGGGRSAGSSYTRKGHSKRYARIGNRKRANRINRSSG